MTTLKEIEAAIERLSQAELSKLRDWFEEFDAEQWDEQLERDVAAGKLDAMAEQAIADFKAGKCDEVI